MHKVQAGKERNYSHVKTTGVAKRATPVVFLSVCLPMTKGAFTGCRENKGRRLYAYNICIRRTIHPSNHESVHIEPKDYETVSGAGKPAPLTTLCFSGAAPCFSIQFLQSISLQCQFSLPILRTFRFLFCTAAH